jgi:cell division protein FtsL
MRALAVVRALPEHSLIDRLVRGRAWIPVLGVLLAGIVAMQVEVLKLGTNVGKLVQRSTALQSQNESLQASVASLGDDQRIERLAAGMGMAMPAPTTIAFLRAAPGGDPRRAIANLHAPDPTTFANELAAQAASAAAASMTAAASTATSSATTSTGTSAGGPSGAATTVAPVASTPPAQATTQSSAAGTAGGGSATQSPATATGTQSPSAGAGSASKSPATGAAAMAPASSSQSSPAGG